MTIKCNACGLSKPEDEFYRMRANTKTGRQRDCKICSLSRTVERQSRLGRTPADLKRSRDWKRKHPDKVAAHNLKREAVRKDGLLLLTAAEKAEIAYLYKLRDILTQMTGEPHHVDHVRPLSRGGRHHPSNLAVIAAAENLVKGNTYV